MRDQETGSEWAHQLGQAMAGKLKGQELKAINCEMVTWKSWRERYPDTDVLNMRPTARDFTAEIYRDPSRFVLGFMFQRQSYSVSFAALQQHPVYNFELSDEDFAQRFVVAYDAAGKAANLFNSTLEGQELTFELGDRGAMQDKQTRSTWRIADALATRGPLKGKQLQAAVGIMSFAKSWQDFHPQNKRLNPK